MSKGGHIKEYEGYIEVPYGDVTIGNIPLIVRVKEGECPIEKAYAALQKATVDKTKFKIEGGKLTFADEWYQEKTEAA